MDEITPQREAQVNISLDRMRERLELLQTRTDTLSSRLKPILRNEPSDPSKETCESVIAVPLAGTIDKLFNHTDRLCIQLGGLIDRIEI